MEGLQQSLEPCEGEEIQPEQPMAALWKHWVDLQETALSKRENNSLHQQVQIERQISSLFEVSYWPKIFVFVSVIKGSALCIAQEAGWMLERWCV